MIHQEEALELGGGGVKGKNCRNAQWWSQALERTDVYWKDCDWVFQCGIGKEEGLMQSVGTWVP